MSNLRINSDNLLTTLAQFNVTPNVPLIQQREVITNQVMQRHFVGKNVWQAEKLNYEAVVRSLNPGPDFAAALEQELELTAGGFGPELIPPSPSVEHAFQAYGQTELGANAFTRLLKLDTQHIANGWRLPDGSITDAGFAAYGAGLWRPFRVASNGEESDTVTPSGALVLPDHFEQEQYSTGDIAHPLAILHHELMAHVLPLKAAEGLEPGLEMELICIRFESEMLRELKLQERTLNWGKDDGNLDHTLHERDETYYLGLVRYDEALNLVQIDPATGVIIGPAVVE